MSGCTRTDKPLISILMAVYEPRMDWLRQQLLSLNAQTYPYLMLYIRDDCSPTVRYEEIQSCVQDCISAFPYVIERNERNLGSNGTFERLTREADGDLFAYCDQDDIWLPEKLEILERRFSDSRAAMAYCDVSVIDEAGLPIAESLRQLRPRLAYVQGEDLAEHYFFRNCTAGCTMLIQSPVAKQAVPFPAGTVCDQWLCIIAAGKGAVAFEKMPLLSYRQHAHNQTGILQGVSDKKTYREQRLLPLKERLDAYARQFTPSDSMRAFIEARLTGRIGRIWRYRKFSRYEAFFEIAMRVMPERLIKKCLRRIK